MMASDMLPFLPLVFGQFLNWWNVG
jgi:hypothetical protein